MSCKVIDVSYHNGVIDWEKVKASGVDGAILRCGYGMDREDQDDEQYRRNADECTRIGLPFGIYLYSYADNEQKARSEAQHAIRLAKGYRLSYPVYYDLEQAGTEDGAAERARIFCEAIEAAGYWAGIYANKNWWERYLEALTGYSRWVARYHSTLDMEDVDIWQYTSDGTVDGIAGRVDLNHCYRDYPAEIAKAQNPGGQPAAPAGSLLELVAGTMQGEFGDGEVRKAELGNRYQEVQDMINHIHTAPLQVLVDETLAGKYGNGEIRKIVLGDRYEEVQNRINAGAFDLTGWVRRLQTACNQQGFSDQTVDGKPGKHTLAGCPTVREGASGEITKLIQERLISLGYSCGAAGADGKFGKDTKAAVQAFQKANGLTADGIVGKNTWRKLLEIK